MKKLEVPSLGISKINLKSSVGNLVVCSNAAKFSRFVFLKNRLSPPRMENSTNLDSFWNWIKQLNKSNKTRNLEWRTWQSLKRALLVDGVLKINRVQNVESSCLKAWINYLYKVCFEIWLTDENCLMHWELKLEAIISIQGLLKNQLNNRYVGRLSRWEPFLNFLCVFIWKSLF